MKTPNTIRNLWSVFPKAALLPLFFLIIGLVLLFSLLSRGEADQKNTKTHSPVFAEDHDPAMMPHDDYLLHLKLLMWSKPDSVKKIAYNRLQEISKNNEHELKEYVQMKHLIGSVYIVKSQYDRALDYLYESLEISVIEGFDNELASTYNVLGIMNMFIGNYRDALNLQLQAKDLISENDWGYAAVHINLGRIYFDLQDFEKSNAYHEKAHRIFQKLNHPVGLSQSYYINGVRSLRTGEIEMAEEYLMKSKQYGYKSGYLNHVMSAKLALSVIRYDQADMEGLFEMLFAADALAKKNNLVIQRAQNLIQIAMFYSLVEDFSNAEYYTDKAASLVNNMTNDRLLIALNKAYFELFKAQGKHEKALEYHLAATGIQDHIRQRAETYKVYNAGVEHLSKQMELQEYKIQAQKMHLSKRTRTFTLIIVVIVFLLIILSSLYYIYINRIKQEQKNKIAENKLRYVYEKNRAVMEAEISERKRLGHELHDGLGTLLSLTRMNMSSVLDNENLSEVKRRSLLAYSAKNIEEAIAEIKTISHNISPPTIREKGLNAAIKELVSRITQFSVELNIYGVNDNIPLYIQNAIYRTIQEALTNVAKYAECSEVVLQVLQNNNDITVVIEDNGCGFDLSEVLRHNGLGLKNATSRIEGLDGKIVIDSMRGRGTIITLNLPLPDIEQGSVVLK